MHQPTPIAAALESRDPRNTHAVKTAVDRLGSLTTYVDQLAGKFPLKDNPGLRSQMRRAAIDSLSFAACAFEAVSPRDHRDLMLRTIGALGELDTFARLGAQSGAVTRTEVNHVALLVQLADHAVRLSLEEYSTALAGAA
ncbi:MAG: hypothetical protein ACYC6T_16650 [Thermoleophilia bacterium]